MLATTNVRARGVTLIELLVVLMILSIVLTAAVRTWDVTLERGRAQTTSVKLSQLATAIEGDPNYIVAGQRADFGFIGDMGELPNSLQDLVVAPQGATLWRGPYLRSTFNQSPDAFRIDGWGDTIIYGYQTYGNNPDSLFVRSYGGRGFVDKTRWQTVFLTRPFAALMQNSVSGNIVDMRGNPPPSYLLTHLSVWLHRPTAGAPDSNFSLVQAGGSFSFTAGVPQGTDSVVATYVDTTNIPYDTIRTVQDVPIYPGIGATDLTMRIPTGW